MATSLTQVTLKAANAAKLYTNSATSTAKVATLNLVSQDPTKNPKVNVSYSSDATYTLNVATDETWGVGAGADQLVSLSTTTATKGKLPYGMNITEGAYGTMGAGVATTSGSKYANEFLDPYYLINPAIYPTEIAADDASHNTILTTPAFAKVDNNDWSWWRDFNVPMESATFATLFGATPNYNTARSQGSTVSYYSRGSCFDPSIQLAVSIHENGYMYIRQWYNSSGALSGSVSLRDGSRTSNSLIYDQLGSSWDTYRTPLTMAPWSKDIHMDHGVMIVDMTNHTSGNNNFRLVNFNGLVRTTYSDGFSTSPEDWITSNRGRNVKMRGLGQVRWLKYNPTNKTYYICIGQQQGSVTTSNECTGLYSFKRTIKTNYYDQWYNSDTGGGTYIDLQATHTSHDSTTEEDPFVQVTGTNIGTVFSDWKMTTPARIGKSAWAAFDYEGTSFFSSDLVTWKTLADYVGNAPTGALMYNEDKAGTTKYFLGSDGTTVQLPSTKFDQIDKAGAIELNTEIGRYERTGIIIPPGQSLYLENIDPDTAVSVSLLTMDI